MPVKNCTHHWVIDPAAGGVESPGVCQKCGAKKRFKNSLPHSRNWDAPWPKHLGPFQRKPYQGDSGGRQADGWAGEELKGEDDATKTGQERQDGE